MRHQIAAVSFIALSAASAFAGETVLYEATPAWVEAATIDDTSRASGSPIILIDEQSRIEDGQLWTYRETAIALDSPEALTQLGTLAASWMPDKGDLRVHRAELMRDGQNIDLLAGDQRFEVLRREAKLESRMLDGMLTATMPVAGARIGDVLRLAYSTTVQDQAMGDHVQWSAALIAKPFPLADGRVRVSWPQDLPVSRVRLGDAEVPEPKLVDGFYIWEADLPVAKPTEMPSDAPDRYLAGNLMQLGTYADWRDVSRQMASHYDVAGTVGSGALADEIARIAGASDDPLERAAMALRVVQDEISYLSNGLDGGNYLPQMPQETWEKRYGDCKAKSVLLLAMLRELEVPSEVVLVQSKGGDILPDLAPIPGNFDHMIVRAEIAGQSYWLDGTGSGTRADTIDTIPRFHYALPLRNEGASLMALGSRPQSTPDRIVRISLDQRAGVILPALVDVEVEFRGVAGAPWRVIAEQNDETVIEDAVSSGLHSVIGDMALYQPSVRYDADTGVATISARGIRTTSWRRDRSIYELDIPSEAARMVNFDADRARAAWKGIPLRLNGPLFYRSEFEILLPEGDENFRIDGAGKATQTIGGVELASDAQIEDARFTLMQTMRSVADELPATDLSAARRELVRFDRALPVLKSTGDVQQAWEYTGPQRKRLTALEAAYARLIAEAEPDESRQLLNRANFRSGVFDFAGALEDINAALQIETTSALYGDRSFLHRQMGDLEAALADLQMYEELSGKGETYHSQIELLALLGRTDEGLQLAEEYRALTDDPVSAETAMATALGWSGEAEEGLRLLKDLLVRRPGDGPLLNAICWHAATFDIVNPDRMKTCVGAVEKSEYAPGVLDSRAFAHLRLGDLDAALADLNSVLVASPGLAESRLLRGVVRVMQGDDAGQEDIDLALSIRPSLAETYAAWGLKF